MFFARILDSLVLFIDWLVVVLRRTGHTIVEGFTEHASLEMGFLPAHWSNPPASDGARLNDSYIREVSWWPRGPILYVWFADGTRARYDGVPQEVYARLIKSATPGEVFQRDIEGHYTRHDAQKPKQYTGPH